MLMSAHLRENRGLQNPISNEKGTDTGSETQRLSPRSSHNSSSELLGDYLTRDQLATELGVSVRTLDRWNTARSGPPRVVVGRTILYRIDSVREWLSSLEK